MQYPVTVNGVTLDDWAYGVTTRTGWQSAPGLRAASVQAAHHDGVLVPERRTPIEPGQFTLSMFVKGRSWPEYLANLDTLRAIFATPRGTVEVTMDTGNGLIRTCQARTVASWAPEHVNPVQAKFTVVMEIPAGVWTAADYELVGGLLVQSDDALLVDCWDPTAPITDALLLLRDPGTAVAFILSDASVGYLEAQRIWLRLAVPAALPADRSLLFDLGGWRCTEIDRPAGGDVDAGWFDYPPAAVVDHTASLVRNGPMFGGSLLPLEPGAGPLPPRRPGLYVDAIDDTGLPALIPEATLAVRPAWL